MIEMDTLFKVIFYNQVQSCRNIEYYKLTGKGPNENNHNKLHMEARAKPKILKFQESDSMWDCGPLRCKHNYLRKPSTKTQLHPKNYQRKFPIMLLISVRKLISVFILIFVQCA